jgi:hypothetical protein
VIPETLSTIDSVIETRIIIEIGVKNIDIQHFSVAVSENIRQERLKPEITSQIDSETMIS